jgi:hypothetical protein
LESFADYIQRSSKEALSDRIALNIASNRFRNHWSEIELLDVLDSLATFRKRDGVRDDELMKDGLRDPVTCRPVEKAVRDESEDLPRSVLLQLPRGFAERPGRVHHVIK